VIASKSKKGSGEPLSKINATSPSRIPERAYHMKYSIMFGYVFSRYFAQIY